MFVALNINYIKGFLSMVHLSGCTCVKGSHLRKSLKKKKEGAKKKALEKRWNSLRWNDPLQPWILQSTVKKEKKKIDKKTKVGKTGSQYSIQ